ncbi:hypothetical protein MUP46_04325 [Patescibacteria group bacterium]|nr:hypothetical protein [Patescibacteria group bacterium]
MKNIEKNLELLATQIAEVRLSELGYRFIPGIYQVFKRLHQFIYAKALIVNSKEVQI